jgi:succinate dehydrogenase/fumarate reductase flavoprotein subunit
MMGGIHINENCETSVPGLYAAGEVSGNVHGARRVSGNAFPEMIVFGARAGKSAALRADSKSIVRPALPQHCVTETLAYISDLWETRQGDIAPGELRLKTRLIMGKHAQLIRSGSGLRTALAELRQLEGCLPLIKVKPYSSLSYNENLLEAFDAGWLVLTARIVCQAALLREESRGFHFREDFPEEKDSWLKHTVVRRTGEDWVSGAKPVVI